MLIVGVSGEVRTSQPPGLREREESFCRRKCGGIARKKGVVVDVIQAPVSHSSD